MATAPRKSNILRFMGATKRLLFGSVICSCLAFVLVACHRHRRESFYASLADVGKADAGAQSWIPDDVLPASSRAIQEVHELSPSTEWCAFEFPPSDSRDLRKNLKSIDALPPSVRRVPSPSVSWWPAVLKGNLDVEKIHGAGFELYMVEKPATSITTDILLFAIDWPNGRAFFYRTHESGSVPSHGTVVVDWKAELAKAKAGIARNPKSGFWHNQAGIAYDALGDFQNAVKELKLASTLDPSNPIDDYVLFAIYKRKAMLSEKRQVLLDALEKDPNNPVGRFEFADILEEEKHWADSLREYQVAKRLAASVKGSTYIDRLGNAYDVDAVRGEVDKAIERVAKLNESAQQQK